MKTTELFIDQLLIGLLVVVTVFALSPMPIPDLADIDLGSTAALAATAYFAGILYDRFADTLLQDQERHHRLVRAIRKPAAAESDASQQKRKEYFAEGRYRVAVLENGEASDYADYLRSRLRLTRALASLLPAMSVALVAFLAGTLETKCIWTKATAENAETLTCTFPGAAGAAANSVSSGLKSWGLLALVAGIYAVVFLSQLAKRDLIVSESKSGPFKSRVIWGRPPRTKLKQGERDVYANLMGLTKDSRTGRKYRRTSSMFWLAVVRIDPVLCLGGLSIFALGCYLALQDDHKALVLIPAAGIVLTLLSGWTWWRIHRTFLTFVWRFAKYRTTK